MVSVQTNLTENNKLWQKFSSCNFYIKPDTSNICFFLQKVRSFCYGFCRKFIRNTG